MFEATDGDVTCAMKTWWKANPAEDMGGYFDF